ncbi:MAG TPA: adenylate/guanylate cyclase domain-containing protein [Blastocatellia bacterium]|nr:adenylate/guanylate cyclase domain-containing protein [Blastocatellia bacterium]
MPNVFYILEKQTVAADPAETILQASLRAGIPHAHACGGNARCSTCRVVVVEGLDYCVARNDLEQKLADRLHFAPDIRLACQTTIDDDVKLRRLVLDDKDLQLTDQRSVGAAPTSAGEEKRLAVLFSDIRGFTPFAEALPAFDVVHVLNRYFNDMGVVISRNRGQIDNYMGDGLMALFGMENQTGAALQAVKAGLEMLAATEHLKPYLEAIFARSFQIGIGIHYGEVVVGAIGAQSLKRVTAIGDAVNLASRIEAANKQAGTRLLISQETYNEVKDQVQVGKTIRATLPGKTGEYALYEVTELSQAV